MFLKGKTALVTGSTSGIGAACAEALAKEGARVMINGFGDQATIDAQVESLSAQSGAQALYAGTDLSDGEAVQSLADRCLAEMGGIDILVNNAGIQFVCPMDEFPVDKWREMQTIMVEAPFLLARAFIPGMKSKDWGRIISTASAHGSVASANKSAYVTAKHAIVGMMREQVLNDVMLAAIPQKKFVMPDQIGAMTAFLCSDAASAITGANMAVDGGWTAQ